MQETIARLREETEKRTVEKMQNIVKEYFDSVLGLPCPDFSYNFYEQEKV